MATGGDSSVYCLLATVFAVFKLTVVGVVSGKTCLKAVKTKHNSSDVSDVKSAQQTDIWRWINFECKTDCCGDLDNQICCDEKNDSMPDTGLITAISVGIFFLVIAVVIIIIVCCLCQHSRQKRSRRMGERRATITSTMAPDWTLPPSYELSIIMSADNTGSAFPADVHPPPSYEDVLAEQQMASLTYLPEDEPGHAHYQGRDNPAFSMSEETSNANNVSVTQ